MKTIPLQESVSSYVEDWVKANIETLDVAAVVSVDKYPDRLVTVRPLCIQEGLDGVSPEKPVIADCPVILAGNVDGFLHFPLRVDDKVLIGYPKDSIEEFSYSNGVDQYYQTDYLKFQGRQAVVLGAVGQVGVDKILSSSSFEIDYFNSKIEITDGDDISLTNPTCEIKALADGNITATNGNITLSLNADGSGVLTNSAGTFTLEVGGNIVGNGCTINTSGNVITAEGTDLDQTRADLDAFKAAYESHDSHPPPPPF